MSRCIYCNLETESDIMAEYVHKKELKKYSCCSEECLKKADKFFKYSRSYDWFIISFSIVYVIVFCAEKFRYIETHFTDILGVIVGILFILYPAMSKHDIELRGIKRNKLLMCVTGVLIIFVNILIIIYTAY